MLRMARTITSANYLRDGGLERYRKASYTIFQVFVIGYWERESQTNANITLFTRNTTKTEFFRNSAPHCEVTRITWAISYNKEEW